MTYSLSVRCVAFGSAAVVCSLLCFNAARAQDGRWAAADDPTAETLINWERQWAEADCTNNGVERTILAEDFLGTSPSGRLYSKHDALAHSPKEKPSEGACTLYEVWQIVAAQDMPTEMT